ncbi:hypothetical protein [Streptomyces platensis]|uniref:hypothetical protein n=1 Tax=Streptomyces platensis TaxID=58346 RepID=UPI002E104F5A|nr:hypothetical protein OG229_00205 [Streptomyces platensis]WUB85090.1 hypothetical protein OG424_00410 [Streptomyces platensis]
MPQTKFDRQVEETVESLAFGIGRALAGRDLDGVKRTDATFWRPGTRVLPKVEGRVRRRSYFELVQPGEGALDHPPHLAQPGTVGDTASGDHRPDAACP